MKKRFLLPGLFVLLGSGILMASPSTTLSQIGVQGGIVAVLNDPSAALAVGLVQLSNLTVYLHLNASDDLNRVQSYLDSLGYYGTRIYVEKDRDGKLPFGENFLDAVASETPSSFSQTELLRVLRPGAKAVLGTAELTKPTPSGFDPWTHPHHSPDNSAFSHDTVIKPPYLTKFMVEPRNGPYPQAVVAAGHRIFRAFGHIDVHTPREEKWLNTLMAFDAYNGSLLWKRPITPGIMVARNTMVATPDTLFVGDTAALLYVNATTGQLMDAFVPPVAGGTFWKWVGRENGAMVALVGAREQMDPTTRNGGSSGGWGWPQLSAGFTQSVYPWGFGQTVIAFNPGTKQILWKHTEATPVDSRGMCMKNGRIFILNWKSYLVGLDAATGAELWRKTPQNAPEIFGAIGSYPEGWGEGNGGWRTLPFLKCNNSAVFIANTRDAGGSIVAVNAATGAKLWSGTEGRSRLIVTDQEVYAISTYYSRINAATGAVLFKNSVGSDIGCTAMNGCRDGIFTNSYSAGYGARSTRRIDIKTSTGQTLFPMRPDCLTGVTISNGHLYWWPWGCSCGMSFLGVLGVGHAGSFIHEQAAVESERLERSPGDLTAVAALPEAADDWPAFRKDNAGGAASDAQVPSSANLLWKFTPRLTGTSVTAPSAAGGLAFFGASDGLVYARDIATGNLRWKFYTGGAVRFPPSISQGRAFVGSGDGNLYALEAATGRLLWRFRAAPDGHKVQMFGSLLSNWPVAAGALVKDGAVYFAAGLTSYDGTHLYALRASDGGILWQNNTSGRRAPGDPGGVALQGQMLIHNNNLYLAGGTEYSPAAYDLGTGTWQTSLTGKGSVSEALYVLGDSVHVSGNRFYRNMTSTAQSGRLTFVTSNNANTLCWFVEPTGPEAVMVFPKGALSSPPAWTAAPSQTPLWRVNYGYGIVKGVALTKNAVVVLKSSPHALTAHNIANGAALWTKTLPGEALPWGMAVDAAGRVLVTLQNGEVHAFGTGSTAAEAPGQRETFSVFSLSSAGPNPFNPTARIHYSVARSTLVALRIHDFQGRLIKTLLHQRMASGGHVALWNGTDDRGRRVGSGLYQCTLSTREMVKHITLCLAK